MDQYHETCERLMSGAQIPRSFWVTHVIHCLPEKAQTVYNSLPIEKANDYDVLKRELLDHYAISPLVYRKNFFHWTKRERQTYGEFLRDIEEQLKMWLHCVVPEGEEADWRSLLLQYRLDQVLPDEIHLHLVDGKVKGVEECAAIADQYVLSRRVLQRTKGASDGSGPSFARGSAPARRHDAASTPGGVPPTPVLKEEAPMTPKAEPWSSTPLLSCDYCKKPGHTLQKCWRNPQSLSYRPPTNPRASTLNPKSPSYTLNPSEESYAMLAWNSDEGRIHPSLPKHTGEIRIANGAGRRYLRDTGATLSFISRHALPVGYAPELTGERVTVSGINHSNRTYPLCKVPVTCELYAGVLTAALMSHDPRPGVSVMLGNDIEPRRSNPVVSLKERPSTIAREWRVAKKLARERAARLERRREEVEAKLAHESEEREDESEGTEEVKEEEDKPSDPNDDESEEQEDENEEEKGESEKNEEESEGKEHEIEEQGKEIEGTEEVKEEDRPSEQDDEESDEHEDEGEEKEGESEKKEDESDEKDDESEEKEERDEEYE